MLNTSNKISISRSCKGAKYFILMLPALLTGCSSIMGNSDYSCSGLPEKTTCLSATEVYKKTNNGNALVTLKSGEKEVKKIQSGDGGVEIEPSMDKVIKNFVSPNLPDKPVPVRTPATVMKIWVNTYEDKSGDLITPGYVFTEIEPRRWVIGKRTATGAPVLKPLGQKGTLKIN